MMPDAFRLERLRQKRGWFAFFACGQLSWLGARGCCRWLTPAMGLAATGLAPAQEALRTSLAGDAAAEARLVQFQSMAYTVKYGDCILQVTPSLEMDWNDNVNLSKTDPESDFILMPVVGLSSSYPVGTHNRLTLSADVGYRKYFQQDRLSQLYLGSGSALSFDLYIKDLWINLHDQFQSTMDSAQEGAVAGTGNYGNFVNTAGLSGTWDLEDVVLTLGYDHQNTESISGQFEYLNRSSEMLTARAGLKVHPTLTVGVEGSGSFTTYEEALLNDYQVDSVGIYGEWHPGSYLTVKPRVGYTILDSSQTSAFVKAQDLSTWYADLTVTHQATDFLSYSLSAGHEIRPGIQSATIEDSYIRPSLTWSFIKDVTLNTSLFYENGSEDGDLQASLSEKSYDHYGGGLSLSYSPTKKLKLSLNYRLTLRSSDVAAREYTQNMVGLQIAYTPQVSQ
jgi:hypothetical protein